jgi:hypothetical protein
VCVSVVGSWMTIPNPENINRVKKETKIFCSHSSWIPKKMSAAMVQKFPPLPPHIQKSPPSPNKKYFAVIFTVVTTSYSPDH